MSTLTIRLFGRLSVQQGAQLLAGLEVRKVQELFCYLLVHRDRPHPRESLASLLWSDVSSSQSKAYLRKTLWQLQSALAAVVPEPGLLEVDEEWVQLHSQPDVWLDVGIFEQACRLVHGVPGHEIDAPHFACVQTAVELYQGDLLEGWYQEWCLFDRERLQQMHLALLEKLMAYCEAHRAYEAGLAYGARILRRDCAHERTHRRLMRLYYLSGDRTSALRQYERCVDVLRRELGVRPDPRTLATHDAIKSNHLTDSLSPPPPDARATLAPGPDLLHRLRRFQALLVEMQRQVQAEIQAVERARHD